MKLWISSTIIVTTGFLLRATRAEKSTTEEVDRLVAVEPTVYAISDDEDESISLLDDLSAFVLDENTSEDILAVPIDTATSPVVETTIRTVSPPSTTEASVSVEDDRVTTIPAEVTTIPAEVSTIPEEETTTAVVGNDTTTEEMTTTTEGENDTSTTGGENSSTSNLHKILVYAGLGGIALIPACYLGKVGIKKIRARRRMNAEASRAAITRDRAARTQASLDRSAAEFVRSMQLDGVSSSDDEAV